MIHVVVSSNAKHSVTNVCKECSGTFVATRRASTCSSACRQAAYRRSAAYKEQLEKKKAERLATALLKLDERNAKYAARNRDRALGFDGRHSGAANLSQLGDRILPRLCWPR